MADVRAHAQELFHLTVSTSPVSPGQPALLTALYGPDGLPAGVDEEDQPLSFPVEMEEGAPGVYSAYISIGNEGVFWARVDVGGREHVVLVRVVTDGTSDADAAAESYITVGAVVIGSPASVQLAVYDSDGSQTGMDEDSVPIAWPQPMEQVPGYPDSWHYGLVAFGEGGRIQIVVTPDNGPSRPAVMTVSQAVQAVASHFGGWEPVSGYTPSDWVSLAYIRRWTGWTAAHIGDEDLKELRRMAIETFIEQTNTWYPAWYGTWHGLIGQGTRLYLPVPLLLPQDGGTEPVVTLTEREGTQEKIEDVDNRYLAWRVRGADAKQPYVEYVGSWWDSDLYVKITGTFGSVSISRSMPIKVKQVLVGLVRWHSLSFKVDADDAKDQSTLYRISSEASRDGSVRYDDRAIGDGLTGDRTVDRALAELTIQPGPWIRRGGDIVDPWAIE